MRQNTTILIESTNAVEIANFLRHLAVTIETKATTALDGNAHVYATGSVRGALKCDFGTEKKETP